MHYLGPPGILREGGRGHCPPNFCQFRKENGSRNIKSFTILPPPPRFFGPSAAPATLPPLFSGYLSFDDYRNITTRYIPPYVICQSRYVSLFSMDRNVVFKLPSHFKARLHYMYVDCRSPGLNKL